MKIYLHKLRGTCGPCSFINLIGLKGNIKIEEQLSKIGRLKPFLITDWTSFLIWAEKYNKNIEVYLKSRNLNEKMFKLMKKYEKIPEHKFEEYKDLAKKRHEKLKIKFKDKIQLIDNSIKKLDFLLDNGYRVVISTSNIAFKKTKEPIPHFTLVFKREKEKYLIIDSSRGLTNLTRRQILKGWKVNKKQGFNPILIAYKKK
ncbi:hypothetical protein HYW76_00925 [Candidatus Pacearchaeota archaeon]|nr:hypothetical protein [Candidatus Pacearchaeota archaeon]